MTATATKTAMTVGTIVQIIGPVLDVEFPPEQLPELYNALTVFDDSGPLPVHLVAEVQQHIGRNQVRAVAMSSTDGVTRGMQAIDTGSAVSVPVGDAALGRILNVLGEPVDGGAADSGRRRALADSPRVADVHGARAEDRDPRDRHQGHRPDRAVREGRQDRPLRRRRRRQDRRDHGAHQQRAEGPRRQVGLLRRGRADARRATISISR